MSDAQGRQHYTLPTGSRLIGIASVLADTGSQLLTGSGTFNLPNFAAGRPVLISPQNASFSATLQAGYTQLGN